MHCHGELPALQSALAEPPSSAKTDLMQIRCSCGPTSLEVTVTVSGIFGRLISSSLIMSWPRSDCAVLVAFNSLLQIVLYSPLAVLYINVMSPTETNDVHVDYPTVARSVAAFLGRLAVWISSSSLTVNPVSQVSLSDSPSLHVDYSSSSKLSTSFRPSSCPPLLRFPLSLCSSLLLSSSPLKGNR